MRRGYAVTACDVSPEMLSVAAGKAAGRARLEEHDMRRLPRLGVFDLVCLLDDAINYLDTPEEVTATLRGVAANLAPDGVVVFDANTLVPYRGFFASAEVVHDAGTVLVWDGRSRADFDPGDACEAELLAFLPEPDGRWRLASSLHRQRHHPRETVEAALADAGLELVEAYGMQLDGAIAEGFDERENSKAVYIARHGAPSRSEGGEGR
jgi:SAM-dependent methyltransferase